MTVPFDKYIVWQCPECGKWQGKQNNKWTLGMSEAGKMQAIALLKLKCISPSCKKVISFKDKKKGGVRTRHYWTDHPRTATAIIQKVTSQSRK